MPCPRRWRRCLPPSCPKARAGNTSPNGMASAASHFAMATTITLTSKSGKPLARYFPEVVEMLRGLKTRQFLLDGELIIPVGDALSFDALQLRLHPAESRVRKLAAATPAELMAFDLLELDGKSLLNLAAFGTARALEQFFRNNRRPDSIFRPMTCDRGSCAGLAAAQRRRARRRDREARRPGIPVGRTGDDQGQAAAHCRLRRRRLPLRREKEGGRLAPTRPLRWRRSARPCRLHLGAQGGRAARADRKAREADRAPGFHRQCAGRSEPLGQARSADGSRSSRCWWSKSATTRSPPVASVTAPGSSAGDPTRTQSNAPSSSSRRSFVRRRSGSCLADDPVVRNAADRGAPLSRRRHRPRGRSERWSNG